MSRFHTFAPLPLALLLLVPTAAVAADTHVVRLERREAVGDRYRASGKIFDSTTTTLKLPNGESETERELNSLDIDMTVTVLEVNSAGEPTRLEARVSRATTLEEGKSRSLRLDGKALSVACFPELVITAPGGAKLDERTLELLELAFSSTNAPEDSEKTRWALDPPGPVEVGAEWEGKNALISEDLRQELGPETTFSSARASGRLVRTRKVNGIDALEVAIRFDVDDVRIPIPDFHSTESLLSFEGSLTIPEGDAGIELEASARMKMKLAGEVRSADMETGIPMTIESTRTEEWTRTPIAAKK